MGATITQESAWDQKRFPNLETVVGRATWPTPTACMHKGSSEAALTRADGQSRENDRLDHAIMASDGGTLNPDWVELLMGWPLGWTNLNALNREDWDAFNYQFQGQGLRELWEDIQPNQVQREAGGRECVQGEKALLPVLREQQEDSPDRDDALEGQKAQEELMRGMRRDEAAASSPLRPESAQQLAGEPSNAVQVVPRLLARYGKEAWASGSWENGVPRVARGVPNKGKRLKAIGNGQVPAALVLAWNLLSNAE